MICFIALTMMRILQYKLQAIVPKGTKEDPDWTYGLHGCRLAEALKAWSVDELPGDLFRMQNVDFEDLLLILKSLGVDVPCKIFSRGDLRALKSSVKVF